MSFADDAPQGLATIKRGRDSKPPRICLYGPEGIGKSTFAAGCPVPVFIQLEDGLDEIDADKFPKAETLEQVKDQLDVLIVENHQYQTVVIDTADWLEKLIHKEVCRRDNKPSIELCNGGYGKGYGIALDIWKNEILARLDALRTKGMIVVLLAHARVERFEDPDQSVSYDRYSLKLNCSKSFSSQALISEWVDALLFATRKVIVRTEETKPGKVRGTAVGLGADGGTRIIRPYGSPSAVAKNRYGISTEIPLSWQAFLEAVTASRATN
jgi:hypothetical protein